MSLLNIIDVEKVYGSSENKVQALENVNFEVEEGEMIAIMGPSGSGKSTMLNILGFLDKPTNGKYIFDGEDTEKLRDKKLAKLRNKHLGFVVQNFALVQDYTVYQNIKIPLDYAKVSIKEKKKRIDEILDKLGISDKKNKLPKELSGGQNQRVAIARALVNNPKIILADEPTGALDKKTGQEVMDIFTELNKEGRTIIIITHDERIAKQCKRIMYIEDGRIREEKKDEEK